MNRRPSMYQCGECGPGSSPIHGYMAFKHHLNHCHGLRNPSQSYVHSCSVVENSDRNMHFNVNEFTSVLGNVSDIISRNVNQGIGTLFQASTSMANMMTSRSSFPMFSGFTSMSFERQGTLQNPTSSLPANTHHSREIARPKNQIERRPKRAQPIVISDSDDDPEPFQESARLSRSIKAPRHAEQRAIESGNPSTDGSRRENHRERERSAIKTDRKPVEKANSSCTVTHHADKHPRINKENVRHTNRSISPSYSPPPRPEVKRSVVAYEDDAASKYSVVVTEERTIPVSVPRREKHISIESTLLAAKGATVVEVINTGQVSVERADTVRASDAPSDPKANEQCDTPEAEERTEDPVNPEQANPEDEDQNADNNATPMSSVTIVPEDEEFEENHHSDASIPDQTEDPLAENHTEPSTSHQINESHEVENPTDTNTLSSPNAKQPRKRKAEKNIGHTTVTRSMHRRS